MAEFWEKKSDVLVSTTIIESGIDIPNANTLIVERGDTFGLAQLHQLRGRVGRGRERAYAYFLYPPEKPLTETAHERLATIAQHTEMGAGMYVAMKDLEIRGAGNLLGGEQSGHIAGVGFDLYVRMVGEAVADYRAAGGGRRPRGGAARSRSSCRSTRTCRTTTRRASGCGWRRTARSPPPTRTTTSRAVREELTDRYGPLPEPVENLLLVAGLRMLARAAGVTDITLQGNNIRFGPVELRESQELRLKRLYPGSVIKQATRQVLFPRPTTTKIGAKPVSGRELLAWVGEFLATVPGAWSAFLPSHSSSRSSSCARWRARSRLRNWRMRRRTGFFSRCSRDCRSSSSISRWERFSTSSSSRIRSTSASSAPCSCHWRGCSLDPVEQQVGDAVAAGAAGRQLRGRAGPRPPPRWR